MINTKMSDSRGDRRDPFEVLAEMAAEVSTASSNSGEKADSVRVGHIVELILGSEVDESDEEVAE